MKMNPEKKGSLKAPLLTELPSSITTEGRAVTGLNLETNTGKKAERKERDRAPSQQAAGNTGSLSPTRQGDSTRAPGQQAAGNTDTAVPRKKKRKNLSGAAWKKRKEAAQKQAQVHETNAGKRPLSTSTEGSTPRVVKRRNLAQEGSREFSRAVATDLKMAIVPADYPEGRLDEEQGKKVVEALEEVIDNLPDGSYFPSFLENWHARGAQIFHCNTEKDRKWLEEKVKGWSPWEGAQVRLIEQGALQKMERMTIFVKGKLEPQVILKRLARQNPTLKVDTWRAISAKEVSAGPTKENEKETSLRVILEKSEVEAVKALDFRPFCGASRAHCVLFRERMQEDKEGKAEDAMEAEDIPAAQVEQKGEEGGEGQVVSALIHPPQGSGTSTEPDA